MTNKPILSICIPTYQRKEYLKRTLEILTPLIEKHKEIEICISDNGSTDGTENLLEEYSKKYQNIRYRKNKKNLGYDINFYKVIKMAKGKYVWTIGDDDLPQNKKIFFLFEEIKNKEYDIVIVNSGDKRGIKNIQKDFEKEEYTQKEFIEVYKNYLRKRDWGEPLSGFISCFLYKKSLIDGSLKNEKHFGWIHYALFIKVLTTKKIKSIFVYKEPTIIVEDGQMGNKIFLPYQLEETFCKNRIKAIKKIGVRNYQYFEEIINKEYKKKIYVRMLVAYLIGKEFFDKETEAKNERTIKSIEKILENSSKIEEKLLLILGKCFFELSRIKILQQCFVFVALFHPRIRRYRKLLEMYKQKKIEDEKTRVKY